MNTNALLIKPPQRIHPEDLQTKNIVVLRGVCEAQPDICAIGWVEDKPHEDGEAVVLHEPLYFMGGPKMAANAQNPNPPQEITFNIPEHGVPEMVEFSIFDKVEVYEGIIAIGVTYIEALLMCRKHVPNYAVKWTYSPVKHIAHHVAPHKM